MDPYFHDISRLQAEIFNYKPRNRYTIIPPTPRIETVRIKSVTNGDRENLAGLKPISPPNQDGNLNSKANLNPGQENLSLSNRHNEIKQEKEDFIRLMETKRDTRGHLKNKN